MNASSMFHSLEQENQFTAYIEDTLTQEEARGLQDDIEAIPNVLTEWSCTEDGKQRLKTPSGSLSPAEAVSVLTNGMALAAHFGNGSVQAGDVASSLIGAVVKDPVQDAIVWEEYLERVVKEHYNWNDLYRACRDTE